MSCEEINEFAKSAENKSLIKKYDIPIEHLSYEYITECENVKELERIVLVLRSGEEGHYPDLTKHAEEKLRSIKPESTILRIAEPVIKKDTLSPEKRIKMENEINEWMSEMKCREKDLEEGRASTINEPIFQPAVRKITIDKPEKKMASLKNEKKNKRIGGCDYAGWDKYDADTELNRIDLRQERKQAETKRIQKKNLENEKKMKKLSKEEIIDKLTLTGTEIRIMAEKEREKGNEAFKAGDYEEALQFYNSSIAVEATINSYNNRAITFIKLQRYQDAVNDCNSVISMDHTNVKALLRRGFALVRMEKNIQALADYEAVLKIEPSDKTAIAAINKLRKPCASKKIRMKIEDVPMTKNDHTGNDDFSNVEKNSSKSLRIIEKKSSNFQTKSKNIDSSISKSRNCSPVCFCDNAPTSSQYTSPQPHFRDIYCPKMSQCTSKFPKTHSIFTDTQNSRRKASGVIIEEIPNEPLKKCKKNVNSVKSNETLKKFHETLPSNFEKDDESNFISENVTEKNFNGKFKIENENNDNETCEKASDKDFGIIIEDITKEEYNSASEEKTIMKLPEKSFANSKKSVEASTAILSDVKTSFAQSTAQVVTETSDKLRDKFEEKYISYKNGENIMERQKEVANNHFKEYCTLKIEESLGTKMERLESPYEFLRLWNSMKNDNELLLHAHLLKALSPDNINTVIGNKLDGEMLSKILKCFEKHFRLPEDSQLVINFLRNLGKLKRFSIVKMFMDDADKKVLRNIFSFLKENGFSDAISDLKSMYDIPM